MKKIYLACSLALTLTTAFAGNPDRQGEAGANQLLINPWARSAGLHTLNTSSVTGSEAMFINVAGLARVSKTQINLHHTRYLDGAELSLNALGFAQKVGNGAFGISLVAFDLGEFEYTTEQVPGGSGATFSPSFFNLGVSYSHVFANKVSVGATVKVVSESAFSVAARAVALDAGVQYVSGENDNFKFGISLRNIGNKMQFRGEGLGKQLPNPGPTFEYSSTYYERSATYELPSQLNIGASYDWILGRKNNRLSLIGNFTSNSFSRDLIGAGVEFTLGELFALRAAYKYELDADDIQATIDNGPSAGFSVSIPTGKKGGSRRISLDYGYRYTKIFNGNHNLGLRLDL